MSTTGLSRTELSGYTHLALCVANNHFLTKGNQISGRKALLQFTPKLHMCSKAFFILIKRCVNSIFQGNFDSLLTYPKKNRVTGRDGFYYVPKPWACTGTPVCFSRAVRRKRNQGIETMCPQRHKANTPTRVKNLPVPWIWTPYPKPAQGKGVSLSSLSKPSSFCKGLDILQALGLSFLCQKFEYAGNIHFVLPK